MYKFPLCCSKLKELSRRTTFIRVSQQLNEVFGSKVLIIHVHSVVYISKGFDLVVWYGEESVRRCTLYPRE